MEKRKLLMFDLDGTLIDSVGGIVQSVNVTRIQYGFAPLSENVVVSFTGDGIAKLTERSFADVGLPESLDIVKQKMMDNYAADPLYKTGLYDGVKVTLEKLSSCGWLLAVISNKPEVVGEKILEGLDIMPLLCENIGGGRFPLKPAPDAINYLLEKYAVAREDAMMVGDNHTDINSGKNAKVKTCFCKYGFGTLDETVPDFEIDSFAELLSVLEK